MLPEEMEEEFPWIKCNVFCQGAFCKEYIKKLKTFQRPNGGAWVNKPFETWKNPKKTRAFQE